MRLPAAVLVLSLLGAPALAAEQLHLAVPGLTAVGMSDARAAFFTEHLASALARSGARVTTAKAVSEVIGLERQRQLMGCSESGCAMELANALGADAIISGEIAALSSSVQCNVKLLSSRNGEVLETLSVRAATDEALLDQLDEGARKLVEVGAARLQRTFTISAQKGPDLRVLAVIPAALAVAAGVTGGVLLGNAQAHLDAIPVTGAPISDVDAQAQVAAGKPLETAGWVAVGVGGACAVAAVVMFVAGSTAPSVSASVTPLPGGGVMAGVGGRW